ncbi:MAG: FtsQ-type POTRA domain-containing protein [Patescibacteria group bacterium]
MVRRRDYSKKKFRNPLFKGQDCSGKKRFFYYGAAGLLIVGALYFIFYSDFFEVKNIDVSGNKNIITEEIIEIAERQIEKRRFFIFSQRNFFMFNGTQLEDIIAERFFLEKVKVKKILSNKIKIEIFERSTSVVWISRSRAYYIDPEGLVISMVVDKDITKETIADQVAIYRHQIIAYNLPYIYDVEGREVEVGKKIASPRLVSFIIDLVGKLPKALSYEISYYNYNAQSREIAAVTAEGWQIKFSFDSDLETQIDNLSLLLKEKIKNTKQLDYIDLRFGERIFYK